MANEKRLIDANALVKLMCRACNNECCEEPCEPGECFIYDAVSNAPTVDAVEVVRCEKCKHYQQYHKGRTEELCEWGKCKLISMDVDMPCNGFCCFGERRTE